MKQFFASSKAEPGMAPEIQPRFSISPRWSAIAELSFKTKDGQWVTLISIVSGVAALGLVSKPCKT